MMDFSKVCLRTMESKRQGHPIKKKTETESHDNGIKETGSSYQKKKKETESHAYPDSLVCCVVNKLLFKQSRAASGKPMKENYLRQNGHIHCLKKYI